MNPTQVGGIFRDLIKAIGVIAVAYGYVDGGAVEMIAGVVATVAASAWSWYTNKTKTMISTLSKSSEVKKIVTTRTIAKDDPSPKVVAS